jgi:hypothetical protein
VVAASFGRGFFVHGRLLGAAGPWTTTVLRRGGGAVRAAGRRLWYFEKRVCSGATKRGSARATQLYVADNPRVWRGADLPPGGGLSPRWKRSARPRRKRQRSSAAARLRYLPGWDAVESRAPRGAGGACKLVIRDGERQRDPPHRRARRQGLPSRRVGPAAPVLLSAVETAAELARRLPPQRLPGAARYASAPSWCCIGGRPQSVAIGGVRQLSAVERHVRARPGRRAAGRGRRLLGRLVG